MYLLQTKTHLTIWYFRQNSQPTNVKRIWWRHFSHWSFEPFFYKMTEAKTTKAEVTTAAMVCSEALLQIAVVCLHALLQRSPSHVHSNTFWNSGSPKSPCPENTILISLPPALNLNLKFLVNVKIEFSDREVGIFSFTTCHQKRILETFRNGKYFGINYL